MSTLNALVLPLEDRHEIPVWQPSNRLSRTIRSPCVMSEMQSSRVYVSYTPSYVTGAEFQVRIPSTPALSIRTSFRYADPLSVTPAPLQHCFICHHLIVRSMLLFTVTPTRQLLDPLSVTGVRLLVVSVYVAPR